MRIFRVYATAAIAAFLLYSAAAHAQANRTFVSGDGLDTNPCTNTAPCRSFARAIAVTNAGGEVSALGAAGYGAVTITKAISIVSDGGGEAGINDPGSGIDAIDINAGASDVVNLRGLVLNGVGTGRNGITFNTGAALNIQNCQIRNFAANGVQVVMSSPVALTISDTIVSNNGGVGISITAAASGTAYLQRVAAVGNGGDGIFFLTGSHTITMQGTIVDSVAVGNGSAVNGRGFTANGGAVVTLINSKAIRNGVGVSAPGTVYMSQTTLAGNVASGFVSGSGGLHTFGDNYIIDTTNSGTLTPIAEQ